MPLQWRNQIWQSLEEGAGKRCSERDQYPNLSEGADGVGIDNCAVIKEFPLSGVTSSGRVWRKVPENDARNVTITFLLSRCSFL